MSQTWEDDEELEELMKLRNYPVVKHNSLIQKSRFQLSAQEQKIILYLISKIRPDDINFEYQEFDIADFCKVCGIDYGNGKNYKNLKDAIKGLSDKSEWILIEDEHGERDTLMRWINKAWIYGGSGKIRIRLDDDLKPYLLDLRNNFTSYELLYILAMRSQYSIRLYEILRSYEFKNRPIKFNIETLKSILSAENHTIYNNFKRKVLDIAMREINDLSDISVSYTPLKDGSRSYKSIEFAIQLKEDFDERLKTWARIGEVISPEQMTLFELIHGEKYEND